MLDFIYKFFNNIEKFIMLIVLLNLICGISYILYTKCFKKNSIFNFSNRLYLLILELFLVYISGVITVTFFSGHRTFFRVVHANFSLFSSHIDAILSLDLFSTSSLFIIFNIIMFLPLGIFLPLLCKKLNKYWIIFAISTISSLTIELFQYNLRYGSFDIDDIFNNVLGSIIGYGLYRFFYGLSLKSDDKKMFMITGLIPIGSILLIVACPLIYYYFIMDYGIASHYYFKKQDMSNIEVTTDINFDTSQKDDYIYLLQEKSLSKDELKDIATDFFNKKGSQILDIEYRKNPLEIIVTDSNETNIYVDYNGDISYSTFNDICISNKLISELYDEETIINNAIENINNLGISIPSDYERTVKFSNYTEPEKAELYLDIITPENKYYDHNTAILKESSMVYNDNVDILFKYSKQSNTSLTNHVIRCRLNSNLDIMNIHISEEVLKEIEKIKIISEQEAYEKLLQGEFEAYLDDTSSITLNSIELIYSEDSKGYMFPYYSFDTSYNYDVEDTHHGSIFISAYNLKK